MRARALLASRPFSRREANLFVCFFGYTVPACLDLSSGEGLPGGLLEGSCGRRKRKRMPNQLNAGMCVPTAGSNYETTSNWW